VYEIPEVELEEEQEYDLGKPDRPEKPENEPKYPEEELE